MRHHPSTILSFFSVLLKSNITIPINKPTNVGHIQPKPYCERGSIFLINSSGFTKWIEFKKSAGNAQQKSYTAPIIVNPIVHL